MAAGDARRPARARRLQRDHVVAHRAGHPGRRRARPDRRHAVQRRLLPQLRAAGLHLPDPNPSNTTSACPRLSDTSPTEGADPAGQRRQVDRHEVIAYAYQWERCTDASATARPSPTPRRRPTSSRTTAFRYRVKVTATNPAPTFGVVSARHGLRPHRAESGELPGREPDPPARHHRLSRARPTGPKVGDTMYADYGTTPNPPVNDAASSTRPPPAGRSAGCAATATARTATRSARPRAQLHPPSRGRHAPLEGARHRHEHRRVPPSSSPPPPTTSIPHRRRSAPRSRPTSRRRAESQAPRSPARPMSARRSPAPSAAGRTRRRTSSAAGSAATPTAASCTYIQKVASTDPETDPTYASARTTRLHAAHARHRRRQLRPHARRAGQLPAALRRGRHAAVPRSSRPARSLAARPRRPLVAAAARTPTRRCSARWR